MCLSIFYYNSNTTVKCVVWMGYRRKVCNSKMDKHPRGMMRCRYQSDIHLLWIEKLCSNSILPVHLKRLLLFHVGMCNVWLEVDWDVVTSFWTDVYKKFIATFRIIWNSLKRVTWCNAKSSSDYLRLETIKWRSWIILLKFCAMR